MHCPRCTSAMQHDARDVPQTYKEESITIEQFVYHDFNVEPGTGAVLLGEVSMCNDDNIDNYFYEPIGRFPKVDEDEPAYRLLCNEYPEAK